MNIKQSENKNMTNEYRYFLYWNFVLVNRFIVLVYSKQDNNSKKYRALRYYLEKSTIKNSNVIINGKNFYGHPIDSPPSKRYEEIRKLTQGKWGLLYKMLFRLWVRQK